MKAKIEKVKNEWHTALHKGNGGISSLIIGRQCRSFWKAISIFFSIKYLYRGLFW